MPCTASEARTRLIAPAATGWSGVCRTRLVQFSAAACGEYIHPLRHSDRAGPAHWSAARPDRAHEPDWRFTWRSVVDCESAVLRCRSNWHDRERHGRCNKQSACPLAGRSARRTAAGGVAAPNRTGDLRTLAVVADPRKCAPEALSRGANTAAMTHARDIRRYCSLVRSSRHRFLEILRGGARLGACRSPILRLAIASPFATVLK